jgi:hypothetical protein
MRKIALREMRRRSVKWVQVFGNRLPHRWKRVPTLTLSCSTHAPGHMALQVQLRGLDGSVLDELRRA